MSKDSFDGINPVAVSWSSDNMSHTGITAQDFDQINSELNSVTIDLGSYGAATDTISFGSSGINLNDISISSFSGSNNFSISNQNSINGVDEIHTAKGKKIDLDELADVLETVKKRLLILAPNFELHEKYPMLKEMYEEYKAMEKLLGGPDRNIEEDL